MPQEMDSALVAQLAEMAEYCRNLQLLLKSDQAKFSQNDIKSINESNQQKNLLIGKISQLASQINTTKQGNDTTQLLENLETLATQADLSLREQALKAVTDFKNELANCYHAVLVNNNIVTANLQNLKNIWDKIAACNSEATNVYDRPGSTSK